MLSSARTDHPRRGDHLVSDHTIAKLGAGVLAVFFGAQAFLGFFGGADDQASCYTPPTVSIATVGVDHHLC